MRKWVLIGIVVITLITITVFAIINKNYQKNVVAYQAFVETVYDEKCKNSDQCMNVKIYYEFIITPDNKYKYIEYCVDVDTKDIFKSYQSGTYKVKNKVLITKPKTFKYNDRKGNLINLPIQNWKISKNTLYEPTLGVKLTKIDYQKIKYLK